VKRITVVDQQVRTETVEQPPKRRRFTPSLAYTILLATGVASGFAGIPISEGDFSRLIILLRRPGHQHLPAAACRPREAEPVASLVHDIKKRQQGPLPRPGRRRHPGPDAKHKTIPADFGLAFAMMSTA
jgi:hypothetical protein